MILSFVWSHVDAKGPFKVNDRQEVNYFTYLIQKPLLVHIMKSGEIRKGQDNQYKIGTFIIGSSIAEICLQIALHDSVPLSHDEHE